MPFTGAAIDAQSRPGRGGCGSAILSEHFFGEFGPSLSAFDLVSSELTTANKDIGSRRVRARLAAKLAYLSVLCMSWRHCIFHGAQSLVS